MYFAYLLAVKSSASLNSLSALSGNVLVSEKHPIAILGEKGRPKSYTKNDCYQFFHNLLFLKLLLNADIHRHTGLNAVAFHHILEAFVHIIQVSELGTQHHLGLTFILSTFHL